LGVKIHIARIDVYRDKDKYKRVSAKWFTNEEGARSRWHLSASCAWV
jgi:hypothetical protein